MTRDEIRELLEQHHIKFDGSCSCGKWQSKQVVTFFDRYDHYADVLHEALNAEGARRE